jgi:signal transduction histidine kinase
MRNANGEVVLASVPFWCYVLLVGVWALDILTPQLFVAAIFFNVPIALSSISLDVFLTRRLLMLAIGASISAAYINALTEHRWETIAVADRVVAGFSFLLVGFLSITAQRFARRAGELSERSEREARELLLRIAVDRVRESLGILSLERSLVYNACASMEADIAWYHAGVAGLELPTTYRCERARVSDREPTHERLPAPIASLVERVLHERRVLTVGADDPFGRLVLSTLGVAHALAAPLVEHDMVFGVLLIARRDRPFAANVEESLRYYVDQAAVVTAQGRLFEELAQRNAELTERSEVIRDIVYALSHDLRTPLTAASMTMHQALEGRYGELPASYREVLERSVQSNEELRRLAETLLLVSRYESGEASRHREHVDITMLARDVTHELEALWRSKSLSVRVEGGKVMVLVDRGEVRRAVVNLVANAVTWTPSGGGVVVRVVADERQGCLLVEDTGFGVAPELRDRLFQRIGETSRQGAGTGLGLYIVRRIAEGHGGSVAYAPREGGGSIFTLRLPLAMGVE